MQAAIGGWHCLALDAQGQVYCWGGNEYQQCGLVAAEEGDEDDTPVGGSSGSNGGLLEGQAGSSKARQWQRSSSGGGRRMSPELDEGLGVLPAVRDLLVPRRCMPGLVVKQVRSGERGGQIRPSFV